MGVVALGLILFVGCRGGGAATTSGASAAGAPPQPKAPPEQIAFVRGGSIWLISPDGTGEVQVTDSELCAHPSWSPDGSRLAFERSGDVCVLDVSTREVTPLTTSGDCYQPAWRPGTEEIWYMRPVGDEDWPWGSIAVCRVGARGAPAEVVVTRESQGEEQGPDSSTWRPDGKVMAVQFTQGGEGCGPLLLGTDGNELELQSDLLDIETEWGVWGMVSAAWNPKDPSKIAAGMLYRDEQLDSEFAWALAVVNPGAKKERRLYDGKREWWDDEVVMEMIDGVSWSPDGTQIAFCVWPSWDTETEGSAALWIVGADGTGLRRLTGDVTEVAWSRCPAKVTGSETTDSEVPGRMAFQLDGSVFVEHARGGFAPVGPGVDPSWAPDGSRIAFLETDQFAVPEPQGILVAGADGTKPQRLAEVSGSVEGRPAWSPDGSRIAVGGTSQDGGVIDTISVIDMKTKAVSVLKRSGERVVWSPDGTRIAYAREAEDGSLVLGTCSSAGDAAKETKLAGDYEPLPFLLWAPDGAALVYARAGEVRSLDLKTGAEQQLTELGERTIAGGDWGKDGRIVFAYEVWQTEVTASYAICSIKPDGSDLKQHRTFRGFLGGIAVH